MATMTLDAVFALASETLQRFGADEANAAAVARTITGAERDGSASHGLFRLPGYVKSLRSGRVKGDAKPTAIPMAPGILRVDGDEGFAPLALEVMRDPLVEMTRAQGIAMCGVIRTHHFAALWPEVEALADAGLVAMAMTQAMPYVAPAGGREALFGTNPQAFAWPRPGKPPLAFDQAASTIARGDVMIHRRDGIPVPPGVGIDRDGNDTTDPGAILDGGVQLAFGGYKGSAIALMVELMASSLIGERFSHEAKAAHNGDGGPPVGGEFVLAIDPAAASGGDGWAAHGDSILTRIEQMEGARLPGARRHANRAKGGDAEVSDAVLEEIAGLS